MANRYTISTVFKAVDNMTRPVRRMTGAIGKMTESAEIGMRNLGSSIDGVTGRIGRATSQAAKSAAGIAAIMAGSSAAIAKQNEEVTSLTKALGGSINQIEAIASVTKSAGVDAIAVIDLMEEMKNKLGELDPAGLSSVSDSLALIGVNLHDIQGMSAAKQFETLTNAMLKTESAAQAGSAADMLFGGEGHKVIAMLRQKAKSLEDVESRYNRFSFFTDKGRKGLSSYAAVLGDTGTIMATLGKQISGLLGNHLSPLLTKFNSWMILNKDFINQGIDRAFESISRALGDVNNIFDKASSSAKSLYSNMGRYVEASKWIAGITLAVTSLSVAMTVLTGAFTAFNLALANPIIAAAVVSIGAIAGVAVLIYKNWSGIKAFFSDTWDSIGKGAQIGLEMLKTVFSWSPMGMIVNNFGGLTDYFKGVFGGVADIYESTVGKVMGKVNSIKGMFDFESKDVEVNTASQVASDSVVTAEQRNQAALNETITRTIRESRETFDINVHGQNGAMVSSLNNSPRLNLINTGN